MTQMFNGSAWGFGFCAGVVLFCLFAVLIYSAGYAVVKYLPMIFTEVLDWVYGITHLNTPKK